MQNTCKSIVITYAEVLFKYNLTPDYLECKVYGYLETQIDMYGLKEDAQLACEQLKEHLARYGSIPFRHTPWAVV